MSEIKDRIQMILDYYGISQAEFAKRANLSTGYANNPGKTVTVGTREKISNAFPDINMVWFQTGVGKMTTELQEVIKDESRNLIPFYDDVRTVGSTNTGVDVSETHQTSSEYIDTGDWFRDATAAIRHYGESMTEYPSGCILALREIKDRSLIVPGRDYMIETDEYRVTKRLQLGKDDEHFTAYSTNSETYADGRLVHEPFQIAKISIRRMYLVLGYVVKKNGGTLVFSKEKK